MRQRGAKLSILAVAVLLGAFAPVLTPTATESPPDPQRRRARRAPAPPRVDYTKFSHRTPKHQLACASCHTLSTSGEVTEYPVHAACIGCHREQFFARERPAPRICSVCHVAATPRATARHPFPNPAEPLSPFDVAFPHAKHLESFGGATESCAVCHQIADPQGETDAEYATKPPADAGDRFWLKKGTFMTSPSAHDSCFGCHAAEGELRPKPSDCATCHKLAPEPPPPVDFDPKMAAAMGVVDPVLLSAWRRRDASATFRHESVLHVEVACTSCHDVAESLATTPWSTDVRIQSCGGDMGCHVTATKDEGGALNFELDARKSNPAFACSKCHIAFATAPVPPTHVAAVPAGGAQ